MVSASTAATVEAATQSPNSSRYAVSEGSSKPPRLTVAAARMLPPTALASVVPMLRASVFSPFAAASSWTGVCSLGGVV